MGRVVGRAEPQPDGLAGPLAQDGPVEGEAEGRAEALTERLSLPADPPAGLVPAPVGLVPAPVGLAPVPVRPGLVPAGPTPAGLASAGLVPPWLAPAGLVPDAVVPDAVAEACERGGAGLAAPVAAGGRVDLSAGAVSGLNVATESIAPATRHTARMLASSGMTVPGPENGLVSRRSRFRRRCARSSRW